MTLKSRVKGWLYKAANAMTLTVTGVSLTDLRLGAFLAGGPTYSGKLVTVDSAIQLDTVWACSRLISDTIAAMPLKLYQRQPDDTSLLAREHPLYRILYVAPNADMTAMEFWSAMVSCLMLWGNAFAQVVRRGDGTVIALNPLRPDRMTVRRDINTGELTYTYSYQGQQLVLTEDQIFHIKGYCTDGMMGISPISAGRQQLGSAMAAEETAARMFANGMLSQTYIKSPDWVPDEMLARAKEILNDYSGAVNAGKTPLLEGGWTVESIGMNPEDMQLLQTRGFNVETICRWYGVAPVMIGRMEKSTAWGSGLEQMNLWFLTYTLQPWLVRIEQAISRCLLSAAEKAQYFAKHNVDALLRADSQARAQLEATQVQNGIKTRNEVREKEGLPPLPGGDMLTVQAQMIPLTDVGVIAIQPAVKPVNGAALPSPKPQVGILGDPDE
ncbi:phage portal protein [Acetobacter indonesiensis]|uniref:Capsid protein n=1 Tax=Acetobacter indonesiensis TaxID=104101 RepID=A0A252AXN6_9PROT|nr:phage portal protein [Acetobacter indonesiensis]MCG0995296.1 phage portal protein [Acetobacter indonesiensis]OUI96305.1 capsid protein [Acetobacter indonesiensis]